MQRTGALAAPLAITERADDRPAHRALIRRAGAEAAVLLKNDGILPLDPRQGRIAVIGPNARVAQIMGGGSAQLNPHYRVSPWDGLVAALGAERLTWAPGCTNHRFEPLLTGDFTVDVLRLARPHRTRRPHRQHGRGAGLLVRRRGGRQGRPCALLRPPDRPLRPRGHRHPPHRRLRRRSRPRVGRRRASSPTPGPAGRRAAPSSRKAATRWSAPPSSPPAGRSRSSSNSPPSRHAPSTFAAFRVGIGHPLGDAEIAAAVDAARAADTALVFVGRNGEWDTEGSDLPDITLPGRQDELVAAVAAANPRTVVVLQTGGPVEMPWIDAVPAVLQAWYPGQEAGNAIADVLLGAAEPGGRLPQTFPRAFADNPTASRDPEVYPGRDGRVRYAEGVFTGHRHYDRAGIAPLFAFGHGLGYTTFELAHFAAEATEDGVAIRAILTNTGDRPGATVLQVYVAPAPAAAATPREGAQGLRQGPLRSGRVTPGHPAPDPARPRLLGHRPPAPGRSPPAATTSSPASPPPTSAAPPPSASAAPARLPP